MGGSDRYTLSLHQLTVLDAPPERLVDLAAMAGCAHVCLFTYVPAAAAGRYPLVQAADVKALKRRMADAHVSAGNLEVFPLDGQEDGEAFAQALDVGAQLGATRATAHIHQTDDVQEAADRFAAFAALAARFGITAGLEFMRFSAIPTLEVAAQVVRRAGAGEIACDILHLIRSGGTVDQVRAHADLISYVQLSDGPLDRAPEEMWKEAVKTRALPGKGAFPLIDILHVLTRPLLAEVEVPRWDDVQAGKSDKDRALSAVEASRGILARAARGSNGVPMSSGSDDDSPQVE